MDKKLNYLAAQMGNQNIDLNLQIVQLKMENDSLREQLAEYERKEKEVKKGELTSDHTSNR